MAVLCAAARPTYLWGRVSSRDRIWCLLCGAEAGAEEPGEYGRLPAFWAWNLGRDDYVLHGGCLLQLVRAGLMRRFPDNHHGFMVDVADLIVRPEHTAGDCPCARAEAEMMRMAGISE